MGPALCGLEGHAFHAAFCVFTAWSAVCGQSVSGGSAAREDFRRAVCFSGGGIYVDDTDGYVAVSGQDQRVIPKQNDA